MLIKTTHWLKPNLWHTAYVKQITLGCFSLHICKSGLEEIFDIPCNIKKIRFHLFDTPSKNRVKCRISRDFLWVDDECDGEYVSECVYLGNYLPKRLMDRLAQRKCLYLECEYVETDTEWKIKGAKNVA
jgi:hypothetical protein